MAMFALGEAKAQETARQRPISRWSCSPESMATTRCVMPQLREGAVGVAKQDRWAMVSMAS